MYYGLRGSGYLTRKAELQAQEKNLRELSDELESLEGLVKDNIQKTGITEDMAILKVCTDKINQPIEEMDIPVRAYNCLCKTGIRTIRDLISAIIQHADDAPRCLSYISNLGIKTEKEISAALKENFGLSEEEIAAACHSGDASPAKGILQQIVGEEKKNEKSERSEGS